ncbi:MAG: purine-nucleoside phosphorylase [Gammaproteobacteria bacterium]|nr:purine-nucleoside phosphorylase [Gammaproteobacteria bacterium]
MDEVADAVRSQISIKPRIAMILGSGLGGLADEVENGLVVPYGDLPNWPTSTVIGHEGALVSGQLEGQDVVVMQGRVHYYEGYTMQQVTLPIRVLQRLGVEILIVTNAAGAVNPDFSPGDLMLITDHLNLIGMAGPNPLRGPNLEEFGPRFPDMSQVYDRELAQTARDVAKKDDISLQEGIYVSLAGPSFETPADLRFLRAIGVDAVGMSTVPEAIVAVHGGTRVLGISGISNKANLDGETITTHEEVIEAGKVIVPKLTNLVRGVLQQL